MEGWNAEWLRVSRNPRTFQDFPMPENHHQPDTGFLAAGNNQDAGFLATGNQLHGVPENYHLQPEIDMYGLHVNPTNFPDTLYDFPLESEFSRLSLSAPPYNPPAFVAPPPAYENVPVSIRGGGGGGGNSNLLNYSSVDMSHGIDFSYANPVDIQRRRAQLAANAQMGLYMQPPNYPSLGDHENLEAFCVNDNMNSLHHYDLGNAYNYGRSLNGAAIGHNRPRGHRNGFRLPYDVENQLNSNRNDYRTDANVQYRSAAISTNGNYRIESNKLDWPNGSLYRSRQRPIFSSLQDLRGKICLVAKDQYGCRFLQKKFEERKPEEIHMIFCEVKDHICELMMDQFGNYLIQKFFEVCNQEQMTQLLLLVTNDERNLLAICLDMHGTRAMQKLLEHLNTNEQRSHVISALRCITVTLTKSMNGHHVIEHCLRFFSSEANEHILNVVADNCLDIATDKSGCCVLQHCVANAKGEPRHRLIAEITSNALVLSEHPYGNYVVQYVLGLEQQHLITDIITQLSGHYVSLSMNKYGSNVVEKCLRESEWNNSLPIIDEIIRSSNFIRLVQDPYGNYVAQCALRISKGAVRQAMLNLITVHHGFLQTHPHGKRVLERTRGIKQRV